MVESAWKNNPTKRCVVKFSNTLSVGIVQDLVKRIQDYADNDKIYGWKHFENNIIKYEMKNENNKKLKL